MNKPSQDYLLNDSDEAIRHEDEDSFQRKEFANRLSKLLISRDSSKSISIGIYGKWGEGKTSILNMIKSNLESSELRLIDFNPWMYSDENQLLLMFFSTLQAELKSLKVSKAARIGKWIKEYAEAIGSFTSFTGINIEKGAKKIGSLLADKSINKRRKEIDEALINEGQKFVFFFDDIDRLSPEELLSIFRLVKLTGDFKNVTYVLAFDDEIVANMLSETFAREGHSYLEKMIQLPLRIPKAQKTDLNKYLFDRLNKLFEQNDINLSENEMSDIQGSITLHILPFTDNPRLVVRLINALDFVLPMLVGQVNYHDLIMIEWVKVKYPKIYDVLRDNFGLLKSNFSSNKPNYQFGEPQYKSEDLSNKLNSYLVGLASVEKRQLEKLITSLFPNAKSSLGETFIQDLDYKHAHVEKRICSPDYFERYFTYIVLDGQISDTEFDQFITDIVEGRLDDSTEDFLRKTDKSDLAFKMTLLSSNLKPEFHAPIAKGVGLIAHYFPFESSFFSNFQSMGMITSIAGECIKKLPENDRLSTAKEVFKVSQNIEFTIKLWFNLHPKKSPRGYDRAMPEKDFEQLSKAIFKLIKSKFTFEELVEELPASFSKEMILLWNKFGKNINKNVKKYVESNDEAPMRFLKVFCAWVSSSDREDPYVCDFPTYAMDQLCTVISPDVLENKLLTIYGDKEYPKITNDRDPITNHEIVGIYLQYCKNRRKNLGNE